MESSPLSTVYQTPAKNREESSSSSNNNNNSIPHSNSLASLNSSASTVGSTLPNMEMMKKAEEINLILLQPEVDLWRLRELALSEGGLVNDTLRKRAWPRLVGLDFNLEPMAPLENNNMNSGDHENILATATAATNTTASSTAATTTTTPSTAPRFEIDTTELKKKSDENIPPNSLLVESMDAQQIERDVARCTWHLLTGSQRSRRVQYQNKQRSKKVSTLLKKKQRRLANLINLTLVESYSSKHQTENEDQHRLRYYQGYHDVACIFMHALSGAANSTATPVKDDETPKTEFLGGADFELPSKVLQQISFSHLSDALQSNFLQLQTGIKLVLFPLLAKLDPMVHNHLFDADMEPFFCLSWIITWFSHDVRDTSLVKRLFDAFIVSHPLLPVYVAISMMLHPYNKNIILETDCDFASLHQVLASLPRHSCSVGWKKRRRESDGGFDEGGLEYISDHEDEGGDGCGCGRGNHHEPFMPAAPRQPGGGKSIVTASTEEMEYLSASHAGGSNSVQSVGMDDGSSGQWIAIDSNGDVRSPAKKPRDSSTSSKTSPVPFQDVLDKALLYMKRYPPSCLVELAQKYYADDWDNQLAMLNLSSSSPESTTTSIQQQIGLLRPCPSFSIVPCCTSDWVVKQRLRQNLGKTSSSRKDRRRKTKGVMEASSPATVLFPSEDSSAVVPAFLSSSVDPMEFVKLHPTNLAVIAAGYGPGIGPELRAAKRRRLRRRLVLGAVVVGFLAMGGSLYFQNDAHDGLLGTNATRKMSFGFDHLLVENTICDVPSSFSRDESMPSNSEAETMNKIASTILPRIDVLQKGLPSSPLSEKSGTVGNLPSPGSSRSIAMDASKELPSNGQNGKSKNAVTTLGHQDDIAGITKGDIAYASVLQKHRERLVALTQMVKRLFTRVFIDFILQPVKFIWRALKKEVKMYSLYG